MVKQSRAPAKGKAASPPPAPPEEFRIPAAYLTVIFAGFAYLVFAVWWNHYPVILKVFADYWNRDARYLIPTPLGMVRNWSYFLFSFALFLLFEFAVLAVGKKCVKWALGSSLHGPWNLLLGLGLGHGLAGVLSLALGMNGMLFPSVFRALLGAGALYAAWRFRGWASARKSAGLALVPPIAPALSPVERVLLGFGVFIALFNWLPSMEPEWFYDSLVYHLGVPSRWLVHHRVCHLPDTFFSNFPFLQECQYLFFLTVGNDLSPRFIHWFNGVQGAAAAFVVARPLTGRMGALLAAAVYLSLPQMRFLQHVTMVELGLGFQAMLAWMCFARGSGVIPADEAGDRGSGRQAWLLLGAWYLGFGQGTKYLGIFVSGLLIAWLFLPRVRAGRPSARLAGDVALIVGWGALWTGPWLVKNFLFTGNPVFPMLDGMFPAINWDQATHTRWMFDNTKYGTGRDNWVDWFAMPVQASSENSSFGTFTMNPFFVCLLPLLVFMRDLPPRIAFLGAYSGAYFLIWALSSQQTRFLMPMSPQASVAVAWLVVREWRGRNLLRWAVRGASAWILLVCFYGEVQNRHTNNALFPYLAGYMEQVDIKRIGVGYYDTAMVANGRVPAGRRLLFVGGDENYYARVPLICNSIYDRSTVGEMARMADSPAALRDLFRRRGISHMLVYEPRADEYIGYGLFDWGPATQKVFLDFWHSYGKLVFQNKGAFLYEVVRTPIPESRRKTGSPMWFYPKKTVDQARKIMGEADTLFGQEKYPEALRATEELVKVLPLVPHAWSYRAFALGGLRRGREAARDYEKAISLGYPTYAAYFNLGIIYEGMGRLEQALDTYLAGLEVDRGANQMMERAGDLAFRMGKRDLALALASELLAQNPDNAAAARRVRQLQGGAGAPK